jgi:hypothetical protein
MVIKLGKAIVIVFASLTLLIVPISLFYIADTSTPGNYSIEIQGRFFNARFGPHDPSGFGFFKFLDDLSSNMFKTDSWNTAFTNQPVFGLATGMLMMILWYIGIGMLIIGIIIAIFKTKLSGLFFALAFVADGMQSIVWYLGMNQVLIGPNDLHFPIPISVIFLLVTMILAFTSKKKESYYYSPGYSYGYGRR